MDLRGPLFTHGLLLRDWQRSRLALCYFTSTQLCLVVFALLSWLHLSCQEHLTFWCYLWLKMCAWVSHFGWIFWMETQAEELTVLWWKQHRTVVFFFSYPNCGNQYVDIYTVRILCSKKIFLWDSLIFCAACFFFFWSVFCFDMCPLSLLVILFKYMVSITPKIEHSW